MRKRYQYERNPELNKLYLAFSRLRYKGISLWESAAISLYTYIDKKTMGGFGFQLLRWLKFLFFVEKFKIVGDKNKILMSFLIDRKDHHELFMKSISAFSPGERTLIDAYQEGKRTFKSIWNRFSFGFPNLSEIFKINRYFKENRIDKVIKGMNYWYFVFHTYYLYKKINYWREIIEYYRPVGYLGYNSYRNNDESIATQICKSKGITTFTMQNYSISEFKRMNYEAVTTDNIFSDYMLLWGQAGYDVLKNFVNPARLMVGGNALYLPIKKSDRTSFNPKICTIFLSHHNYTESNFELIDILKRFAEKHKEVMFQFNVHVDNGRGPYEEELVGENIRLLPPTVGKVKLRNLFSESDFVIAHNTTIILEALEYQIPVLQYKDDKASDFDIPDNYFSNLEELEGIFSELKVEGEYVKNRNETYEHYLRNFYQPEISIPNYYKKIILEKLS